MDSWKIYKKSGPKGHEAAGAELEGVEEAQGCDGTRLLLARRGGQKTKTFERGRWGLGFRV